MLQSQMGLDPYQCLAEILEGTISLADYYSRRMAEVPASLEPTKSAIARTIAELRDLIAPSTPN